MQLFDRTYKYTFSLKKYLTDIFWDDDEGKRWAEKADGKPIEIISTRCGHVHLDDEIQVVVPQWCEMKK